MVRKEGGQALLLVLIILAIGTLMIVPALRLTQTSLQSIQIITRHNKGLYVAGAAQEVIMWMLYYGTLTDNMTLDGDSVSFTVDVCDAVVAATVTMRAVENESGVILASDYTLLPQKTVTPDIMTQQSSATLEYTIELKQVSSNTTEKLSYIYDILPTALFTGNDLSDFYEIDSSYISTDGDTWIQIPDPSFIRYQGGQIQLRWPASGNFTDTSFTDIAVADSHYLKFKAYANSPNQDAVYCNWVIIQVGDTPTPSGPQAAVVVGDPNQDRDLCSEGGVFNVWKTSFPEIIPPLVETYVTYTVYITNMSSNTQRIGLIEDILPPGFAYVEEDAIITDGNGDNVSILQAYSYTDEYNGVDRVKTWWQSGNEDEDQLTSNGWGMAAGENITLTFRALATQGVSGSYFNEIFVYDQGGASMPTIFEDIGIVGGYSTYSWNSGIVIVPAYDSETSSEGENVTVNFGLDPGGVTINSWVIK